MMNRTRPNVYLRKRSDKNRKMYSEQRNYCVSLLRSTKSKYYSSLGEKTITDKFFWGTAKPFLWKKSPSNAKIILMEDGEIIKLKQTNGWFSKNLFL